MPIEAPPSLKPDHNKKISRGQKIVFYIKLLDFFINIQDIIIVVNHILSPATVELEGADINNDDVVDIIDVVILVTNILGSGV